MKNSKIWAQKSVCNGYVIEETGKLGNVYLFRFTRMWAAIDFMNS